MFIQKRKIVLKMGSKNWLHVCVIALLALFVLTFFIAPTSAEGEYTYITKWGSYGTGNGQFSQPWGVAVDSSGDVFVADRNNNRIQKFDSSGGFITKWGSEGTGDGQFSNPYGVAVDSSGDVFVADTYNHRIQKFDSSGGFITKWGSEGTGDGRFNHPAGVAVDSSGDVFVADFYNNRIQKFDSSGTYITKWGSSGSGDGQFNHPAGVAVDSSGDVFVADSNNNRIQKFDSSGTYITKWGSFGTGDGQFSNPYGVAVDSSGDVFVADTYNNRIQKFDSSGTYITKWGSSGTGDGQFSYPCGVAVDSSGDVFVADSSNHRIQKFGEGSAPAISVSKTASTNGVCPGSDPLAVSIGDTVTYCFNVSNTGDVSLTSVTVTDDIYGPVTLGTTTLAPGETTEGTITHTVVESDAPSVTDTATATGKPPEGAEVTDTDPCTINVAIAPGIEVVKTASLTGTCPGSDPLAVNIDDTVTYCFNVTNTGDVTLTSVTVNDDVYGPVTLGTTTLAPGETTEGTITHIVTESDVPSVTNTATATGTDPLGDTVTDTDDCTINVAIAPDIEVNKTASLTGTCPGSDPLAVSVGDTVTYCFNVTNTGDVTLTGVAVNDDIYGPVTLATTTLAPGESTKGTVTLGTTTLAPGETTGGTLTHIVTESDVPSVTNIATATGTDPLGGTVTDTDPCTINVALAPDIEVVKTASLTGTCPGSDPLAVNIGDTVTYCFNVSNTGDVTLTGVTVNDDIYGPVTLAATTLAPGESTEGTVTHVVVASDAPSVTNIATATGTDPLGGTVTDTDPCTINVAIAPDIEVVKTASLTGSCPGSDPLAVSIGDTVTYCFNVSNTGDVTLTGVTVNDDIYGPVTLAATTLAPGESTGGTITHIVTESDVPSVTNIATATGTPPVGAEVTDTDPCTINVAIAPGIEVVKTASLTGSCPGSDPLAVSIGDTVTYCFNVTNTGDVNLIGVTVIDDVYGPVTLGTTTLAPGESTGGTLTHIVVESDVPSVTNIATATGTDPLGGTVTDTDPCTINVALGPDIAVIKTASLTGSCPGSDPLAVNIGDTVTYCFIVTNTGDVNLIGVTVIDDVYGPVTLGTTTLAPGETTEGTITHIVVESDVPSVTNIATVTGTDPLGGTVTDTDDCSIDVAIAPDIEVNKTASLTGTCPGSDPLAVNIGDTVTYCFNVSNTGDVSLTSVTVNDDIYGLVSLGTTTLAPGETTEGTITHVVVESDAPSVTNIATATGTDPLGGTVTDTDNCTINVNIHPEVELEKSGSPPTVALGGTVTYTINYANTGAVPLTNVVITENYPDGVTFISASPAPDAGTNNVWTIGTLLPGASGTIVIKVKAPEHVDLSFTETGSVIGEGVVKVSKDLSTEQKPYSLKNKVTLSCAELPPISAYATTNVTIAPEIEVNKTASLTGTCPGSDPLAVSINDTVTYCFNVSNTGDVNLTGVTVNDDIYGLVTLGTTTLAPGESTEGTLTHVVVASDAPSVTNIATATGTDPLGGTVTDTDDCTIDMTIAPGIKVVKTASLTGTCPGSDPLAVNIDDTVTYCFNVSNTGDVNLTGVTVIDDIYGPVSLGTTTLAPGETTEGTVTHVVTESDVPSVTNIATVNATDIDNNSVSDTDDCTINVEPSPCFIATAAYGTALHEDINVLRDFRDEYLVTNPAGRVFVKIYYTTSPPVAALIRNNEGLSTSVREGFVKQLVYITRRFVKGGGQNG